MTSRADVRRHRAEELADKIDTLIQERIAYERRYHDDPSWANAQAAEQAKEDLAKMLERELNL